MPRIFPALLVAFAASTAHAAPADLTVYDGKPARGWHVTAAHSEGQAVLRGRSAVVPPNPKQPEAVVRADAVKAGKRDALVLKFRDTWYASLRIEGDEQGDAGARDLRPYAPDGVLAFDLDVREMSKGGIYFQLGCGEDCERKVPYVLQSRAAAGKGWRHLEFPLGCFQRKGDDFSAIRRPFSIEANGSGEVAVANVRFKRGGKPNAQCPDYRTVSVTPEPLNEPWSLDWWMPRHEQKLKEVAQRRATGTMPELVFVGDSITQGWEKAGKEEWERRYARHHALNLGYSGDRTENILWRLRHGEVDGLTPKVVVLMAGTNNTGHRQEDPATTAAGLGQVVAELRQRMPDAKVLVLGIFPRDAQPDSRQRRINDDVNRRIAGLADNRHVFYHDVSAAFLDADGELPTDVMPDLLHPNARGYALWAEAMEPVLQKLLGGYRWDSVAIGGGGFVTAVVPSPSERGVAYARTDVGGAYRWDGQTARWTALQDWVDEDQTGLLGVDALAVDPHDAARVYLLAGIAYLNGGRTAVLRSHDYGKTFAVTDVSAQFKTHGNGMGRQNGERLAVDPHDGNVLYVGTRADGLFRSADAGATWRRLDGLDVRATPNGVGIAFVLPDPASRRLYVGVSRYGSVGPHLYRSDDGGRTFAPLPGTPRDLMPHRAALDGQGNLFVTFANGAGPHPDKQGAEPVNRGGVWKYAGAAGTWQEVTPRGARSAFSGIAIDRNDPRRMLVSTINTFVPQGDPALGEKGDRIYLSRDGGASWTDLVARGIARDSAGIDWIRGHGIHWTGSIAFDPFDGRAAWVTSGNGVFHTRDLDATPTTWRFAVQGMEETVPLNFVSVPGGPAISVVGDVDGFVHRDPGRYSPTHQPRMGTTFGLALAGGRAAVLARAGARVYTSIDGGVSWQAAPVVKGKNGQLALSADGTVLLHSPAQAATTWRSTDLGKSWAAVAGLAGADTRPVADPVDPLRFYAYQDGTFHVSSDGGKSFAQAAQLPAGGSNVVGVMPGRAGDVWVALRDGGLARSTDGGKTFATLAGIAYAGAVGFGKAADGASDPTVYLWGTHGGRRGVYRSTDAGASWQRINDDAHQYGGPGDGRFIVGDMNVFGRVYMSTAGRGIAYGQPADVL
ncbi:GDSL-type esterase/lipase family protein [Pseudoduganella chitinolytica]|uniref:GDSL-type esterase/lipase family protein n=1 Tax=Pseudoduganella chitinolytica TaxID=34070 RepID=A0ABY8BD80_9BURK|nr:GDSL-type esterase/lipase family protein [Pseudoduganella chitinolytica]WEF33870.1 GDSL-type esterase/lipase family protein [Pseudoduganella chitinolytica]